MNRAMHRLLMFRLVVTSLLCVMWLAPMAAHAKRVALIIGNAQYQNEKPLKNPVNDAHALARTLKEDLQFDDVIERSNVTRRELGRLIDQLGQRAQGADAVVVYYSGHGMQGAGGNYLIPVDAQITSTEDVKLEGVPANDVVEVLNNSGARVALLILDACRDNPFRTRTKGGSKGLARMNVSGGNLLVAYATQEGDTADDGSGSNSPYAQALVQNLKRKDLRVLEVFDEVAQQVKASTAQKQRPTRYGDLPVNVFLTGAPTQLASLQPVPVRPAPNGPTGGSANFGDLERAQREEAAARQKWAAWQSSMKADFNKAASFKGSAELEARAWERFLAAYSENNPFSEEDEQLRADAERRRTVVCSSGARCTSSPSASSQPAKPNRVYRYSDGQSNGYFEQRGEQWREYHTGPDGRIQLFTTFIEYARDSNYVYLEDRNRSRPGRNGAPDYFLVKVPIAPAPFQWSWRSEEDHWNALHLTVPIDRLPN